LPRKTTVDHSRTPQLISAGPPGPVPGFAVPWGLMDLPIYGFTPSCVEALAQKIIGAGAADPVPARKNIGFDQGAHSKGRTPSALLSDWSALRQWGK